MNKPFSNVKQEFTWRKERPFHTESIAQYQANRISMITGKLTKVEKDINTGEYWVFISVGKPLVTYINYKLGDDGVSYV